VITESCCTSPTSSSRWFSVIERTWAISSAASISRSSSGSELKDSTGRPSRATSERASAPSIRLLMRLNWSRNIALAPSPQPLQIAVEDPGLARPRLRRAASSDRLVAREQVARRERPSLQPPRGGPCQALLGGRAVRLAAQNLAEDPLRLAEMSLLQVELAERRRGVPLSRGGGGLRLLRDRLGERSHLLDFLERLPGDLGDRRRLLRKGLRRGARQDHFPVWLLHPWRDRRLGRRRGNQVDDKDAFGAQAVQIPLPALLRGQPRKEDVLGLQRS